MLYDSSITMKNSCNSIIVNSTDSADALVHIICDVSAQITCKHSTLYTRHSTSSCSSCRAINGSTIQVQMLVLCLYS